MKKLLTITLLCLSGLVYGKTIKVNVKVHNQTSDTLTVYIESSENVGSTDIDSKFSKLLNPGESYQEEVETEKHSMISGYSILKNGGRTATKYKLVSKRKDSFSFNIVIEDGEKKTLTDLTNAQKILEYDPAKFLDSDKSPKPLTSLFNNYLGGLVAYTESGDSINTITSISPFDLGTMMKASSASVGTGQNSKEISFVNQNTQNIKGNIPLATQLGVVWNNSSLYNVKIEYKNIGVIDWKAETGNSNLSKAFVELDKNILYNIGYQKLKNPNLKLKQINQAYVFDGVFIEVKQGSEISASISIDISTFFTNSGNFKISKSSFDKKVYGSSYLGYWFNDLAPDLTGSLEYALAVYYSVTNNASTFKNEKEIVDEFKKLRVENPSLPDLNTKNEIQNYYKNQVKKYKELNPNISNDKNLSRINISNSDPLNNLSSEELRSRFSNLFDNQTIKVNELDLDAIKVVLKSKELEKMNK